MREPPANPTESVRRRNPHLYGRLPPPTTAPPASPPQIPADLRQMGPEAGLNKTERAYLSWVRTIPHTRLWIQSLGLRLSDRCFFYPDFAILDEQGMRFIDTKASWDKGETPHVEDDALVKLRWAAQLYAPMRFLIAWKNADGAWAHREIKPS